MRPEPAIEYPPNRLFFMQLLTSAAHYVTKVWPDWTCGNALSG